MDDPGTGALVRWPDDRFLLRPQATGRGQPKAGRRLIPTGPRAQSGTSAPLAFVATTRPAKNKKKPVSARGAQRQVFSWACRALSAPLPDGPPEAQQPHSCPIVLPRAPCAIRSTAARANGSNIPSSPASCSPSGPVIALPRLPRPSLHPQPPSGHNPTPTGSFPKSSSSAGQQKRSLRLQPPRSLQACRSHPTQHYAVQARASGSTSIQSIQLW